MSVEIAKEKEEYVDSLIQSLNALIVSEMPPGMGGSTEPWLKLKAEDSYLMKMCDQFERGHCKKFHLDNAAEMMLRRWRAVAKEYKASHPEEETANAEA